jgi:hypothetical protein
MSGPDSLGFTIEDSVNEYLTEAGKGIYNKNRHAIINLLKTSINDDSMKNELIQKLASFLYESEGKKMFFLPDKIRDLKERIKLYPKIKHGGTLGGGNIGDVYEYSIGDEWGKIDTTTSDYIAIVAGLLLLVGAVGITNLFGGSKHKKRKGRKSKKTKKSMKHKKGRKSKKAKKSMKKKKGRKSMKKKKSNKKRK